METITIAHSKGGTGKSTIIWNLAFFFKSLKKDIVVIDLDFQQTQHYLNLIRESTDLDGIEVLQPQTSAQLIELLEEHKNKYVLIDVGGYDNDLNRTAISWSDKVVVPLSDSVTDVLGFKTFVNILKEIDKTKINVVLNNIHPLTKNFNIIKQAIGDDENITLLNTVIRARKVYKTSLGEGMSVFDTNHIVAQKEIEEFGYEIISD